MAKSSPRYRRLLLLLGDCLFPDHQALSPDEESLFYLAEDGGLCRHYRYHQQKIWLFLSSMRHHAAALAQDYPLVYRRLSAENLAESYPAHLGALLDQHPEIKVIETYFIEDRFFRESIENFCAQRELELKMVDSPKFLFPLEDFDQYLAEHKKPFLKNYYQRQRQALGVLLDHQGQPYGGRWSFDEENRKKLPKKLEPPRIFRPERDAIDQEVLDLTQKLFGDHPGSLEAPIWATRREDALKVLAQFIDERFADFGPYEDAIEAEQVFLFHSTLSPYLNMGLITPREVLKAALAHFEKEETHYPSLEGFVRQIIGWREFLRGIYHRKDLAQNYFGHQRRLKDCWYRGNTGIPPLDDSIKKAQRHGYTHHIERLMVLGNIMLMAEVHPDEVYRWFMEMYVDSADWVMAPNVYGMSQYAAGGLFATKPYISGSNYLRKMSHYPSGDWCDIVDGLYWRFIDRHRDTFASNHRMGMMLATLKRMDEQKKKRIFEAAEAWINEVTESGG